ncbi:MAG: hypothetical protein OXG26_21340 [Caldilineaceae bacterium]|nr:hypothetical protein [Caldilineaceae bacterium]
MERPEFWASTSNKQLNFLQHVRTLLKNHGRAALKQLEEIAGDVVIIGNTSRFDLNA